VPGPDNGVNSIFPTSVCYNENKLLFACNISGSEFGNEVCAYDTTTNQTTSLTLSGNTAIENILACYDGTNSLVIDRNHTVRHPI